MTTYPSLAAYSLTDGTVLEKMDRMDSQMKGMASRGGGEDETELI